MRGLEIVSPGTVERLETECAALSADLRQARASGKAAAARAEQLESSVTWYALATFVLLCAVIGTGGVLLFGHPAPQRWMPPCVVATEGARHAK